MPDKTDEEIIAGAYETTIRQLYATLYDVMVTSETSAEKDRAADAFSEGVILARAVRESAKLLI